LQKRPIILRSLLIVATPYRTLKPADGKTQKLAAARDAALVNKKKQQNVFFDEVHIMCINICVCRNTYMYVLYNMMYMYKLAVARDAAVAKQKSEQNVFFDEVCGGFG